MSNAIIMQQTGGPEVLQWQPFDPGPPQAGEAIVRHEAVGLNFIDVYHRTGLYPIGDLPAIPGMEGAGRVEAVGSGVSEVAEGDRVAYAGLPPGAYAERRRIPAHRLVKLPDAIPAPQAAAMMLQGMTARYLLKGCTTVRAGQTILLHAAAGGVGLIASQWARHLGATVIGTVGTEAKAELVMDEQAYAQQLDLLRFQVGEIEAARLDPEEESTLEESYHRAQNTARLLELGHAIHDQLVEQDDSLLSQTGQVARQLQELATLDPATADFLQEHQQAVEMLGEVAGSISNYLDLSLIHI